MACCPLRYLPTGHVYIDPEDDFDRVVDALLETGYNEEFCLAGIFEEDFIRRLMEAGFLVMSTELRDETSGGEKSGEDNTAIPPEPFYILLPKLHLVRSVLFFPDLRVRKSVRPFLPRYELRVNTDFDLILDKCVQIHGADWLTPPLVEALKNMQRGIAHRRCDTLSGPGVPSRLSFRTGQGPTPVSFGVYREGKLRAGEIGVALGRVYTSYSGYNGESNAGTVQMILTAQWLERAGFTFLDLGMPLDYKTRLGARDITPRQFVELFRAARG